MIEPPAITIQHRSGLEERRKKKEMEVKEQYQHKVGREEVSTSKCLTKEVKLDSPKKLKSKHQKSVPSKEMEVGQGIDDGRVVNKISTEKQLTK